MRIYKHILALPALILALLAVSCEDRFDWQSQDIGEGEAQVDAILEFPTTSKSLGGARSAGNSIQDITKLSVVVFKNDGTILDVFDNVAFTRLESTPDTPSDYPKDENGNIISSDFPTTKVQAGLKLPYGRYTMYAVANLDRALTKAEFEDKEDPIAYLKGIECEWNPTDITKNAQMFGYFTNDIAGQNTAYEGSAKPGNGTTTNPETPKDPTVLVNKPNVSLYSWIKRLASKVTIAYDGSGLKNGIYVYVHNVSIRQIPLKCTLGDGNSPSSASEVTSARFNQSVTEPEQALYYNGNGQLTNASPYDYSGDKYKNWMIIAKGNGVQGAEEHAIDDPALFFYENMQGVHPDRPKEQQPDKVGTNVGPADELPEGYTDEDYRDDVDYGTFIEVEGYYRCDVEPVSFGPIRYRFMLGQNTSDNYDAIRNCHYKLTLGFRGYANQPDWHIEYNEQENEIYAPDAYVPYTYNSYMEYPMRFTGDLIALHAQILENNWAPYYENGPDGLEVPPAEVGTTDPDERTLQLQWNRKVYVNTITNESEIKYRVPLTGNITSANNRDFNYLYGRRWYEGFYHIDEEGNNITTEPYNVTAIWAGFLRLQIPAIYENDPDKMPAVLLYNKDGEGKGSSHYSSTNVLTNFRNYFFGNALIGNDPEPANTTPLNERNLDVSGGIPMSAKRGNGGNSYDVSKGTDNKGNVYTNVVMKLWTQPKSMCGNSGFSGNNPFEDFNRKAVVRFTATFRTPTGTVTKKKDVTFLQAKRLVNPKAVWRRHDNPQDFNVTLMQRDITNINDLTRFTPVESEGVWRATIKAGNEDGFISLKRLGESKEESTNVITGDTRSHIEFVIDFKGELPYGTSSCAIIEIKYHNESCVHNIFVRQGYHEPLQINTVSSTGSTPPYWSSYNLFSSPNGAYQEQNAAVEGTLTNSPLAFGAFYKKGQYQKAISVSNFTKYPAMAAPNGGNFDFVTNPPAPQSWNDIAGVTSSSWHWANFRVENNVKTRTYRVPFVSEFEDLMNNADFGIGVMYGDGATEPAKYTRDAYGFLDSDNAGYYPGDPAWDASDMKEVCKKGMRGFICYNAGTAHQVFFPIGTTGVGRRTIQGVNAPAQRGILRYGSLANNDLMGSETNCMRPLSYNIAYAPGAIYWVYQTSGDIAGWDMNYFDLNFNGVTSEVVSISSGTNSGGGGDALPVRLVTQNP